MPMPDAPQGEAIFAWLPPGDYTVYGFADVSDIQLQDPSFLQSLSGGLGVYIEDQKTTKVTIGRASK